MFFVFGKLIRWLIFLPLAGGFSVENHGATDKISINVGVEDCRQRFAPRRNHEEKSSQ